MPYPPPATHAATPNACRYAVNFDELPADAQSFERLIRRLLRLPNQPAIVIVNTMELVPPGGRLPWEPDTGGAYGSPRVLRLAGSKGAVSAVVTRWQAAHRHSRAACAARNPAAS